MKAGDVTLSVTQISEAVEAPEKMQFHPRGGRTGGQQVSQPGQREVVAGVYHEGSGSGLRSAWGGLLVQRFQLVGKSTRQNFGSGAIGREQAFPECSETSALTPAKNQEGPFQGALGSPEQAPGIPVRHSERYHGLVERAGPRDFAQHRQHPWIEWLSSDQPARRCLQGHICL